MRYTALLVGDAHAHKKLGLGSQGALECEDAPVMYGSGNFPFNMEYAKSKDICRGSKYVNYYCWVAPSSGWAEATTCGVGDNPSGMISSISVSNGCHCPVSTDSLLQCATRECNNEAAFARFYAQKGHGYMVTVGANRRPKKINDANNVQGLRKYTYEVEGTIRIASVAAAEKGPIVVDEDEEVDEHGPVPFLTGGLGYKLGSVLGAPAAKMHR
eukprot:GHVU01119211.1.p1 GENE.GHVU01119211.1~~GHVU01119211.1.p1  ORF type:complete len:229 (-),score=36.00 GHVU01119211.1:1340-1981(-)